jgi:NADH-quinone oxidoreductase subunit N
MINWSTPTLAFFNLLPEIILSLMILVQLVFNVSFQKLKETDYYMFHTVVFIQYNFIIFFTLFLLLNSNLDFSFSNNIFYNDKETKILKLFLIFFSILAVNPIYYGFFLKKLDLTEFYTLFLFSILSGLLLISAGNFISIYLLIEMQALCFYVLTCFKRGSVFTSEAGVKYFIFGAIISSILLLGISLIYGALGTLNLNLINFQCVFLSITLLVIRLSGLP